MVGHFALSLKIKIKRRIDVMAVIADILLIALIVFNVIKNYNDGFICSCLRFGRLIIAFVAAVFIASDVLSFALIFFAVFALISLAMILLKKIKLPVITGFDKLLGLFLGIVLSLIYSSLIITVLVSVCEMMVTATGNAGYMSIYNDSYVLKFIYDLKVFDFIKNLVLK